MPRSRDRTAEALRVAIPTVSTALSTQNV